MRDARRALLGVLSLVALLLVVAPPAGRDGSPQARPYGYDGHFVSAAEDGAGQTLFRADTRRAASPEVV